MTQLLQNPLTKVSHHTYLTHQPTGHLSPNFHKKYYSAYQDTQKHLKYHTFHKYPFLYWAACSNTIRNSDSGNGGSLNLRFQS